MGITYYLMIPFTWMLKFFYGFFNNYGVALILFTLVVKVILFPFSLKGKKSMIQMNLLQGETQKLQKQYGKDQARLNEELNKLYAREGVSPMGGYLWTSVPLMILIPLYAIIRRPLKYWLGLNDSIISAITEAVKGLGLTTSNAYPEISIASAIHKDPAMLAAAQKAAEGANIYGINFKFLGVDLAATPTPKFWTNGWSWASIGLILIPLICVGTSFLSTKVMMKTNEVNGQSSQANQNKFMQYLSPLMMLWFSFIMPAGMGLYMIINNALMMAQEVICGKMLKKDYEKAAEARRLREIEEKEEEKRLRREKAEQRAREAEEAKKLRGKKKPKEKEDGEEGTTAEQKAASREGMRQYARGRAYDPNRYGGVTPYHEDTEAVKRAAEKAAKRAAAEAKNELPAAEELPAETVETETVETVETEAVETVETPAEEVPAEETPVEEVPAEEAPVEETPAEEVPAQPETVEEPDGETKEDVQE